MTYLIIGENASGKTLALERYLKNKGYDKCNSNLKTELKNKIEFSRERLDVLGDLIESDIRVLDSFIAPDTNDYGLSRRFFALAEIICKDLDYLVLDEPEQLLTVTENLKIVQLLCQLSLKGLYKEILITTHEAAYFAIPDSKYYTVKMDKDNNIKMIEITEDKAYEIINSI